MSKKAPPEVMIIYTPGDGQAHIIGARRKGGKWLYSGPVYEEEEGLNEFLSDMLELGHNVLDVRVKADIVMPGMSKATPVVVYQRHVTLKDAVEAAAQMHQAILDLPED